MGLFSKKQKVDYDALFKEQYKSVNQLTMQAHNELDYVIKESLFELIVVKYNELITIIDQGDSYYKAHFESLRENSQKELKTLQDINKDEL